MLEFLDNKMNYLVSFTIVCDWPGLSTATGWLVLGNVGAFRCWSSEMLVIWTMDQNQDRRDTSFPECLNRFSCI